MVWTKKKIKLVHTKAFLLQVVILARVIVDRDQVYLTADGVTKLVNILKSEDETAVILAG